MASKLKIIDSHVHLGLGKMPEHCYDFVKIVGSHDFRREEVLLEDDEVIVEKVVLVPSYPCGSSSCTDGFYSQVKWRSTDERFLQYGTLNPNCQIDVKEELGFQYDLGIVGIKLHPVHHFFKPNAYREEEGGLKQLEKIYEFAQDHSLPVIIHTGTSVTSLARNKYGDPIFIQDIAEDFPKLKIVLAHSGRPFWTRVATYLAESYNNVFLEISSIPPMKLREYLPNLENLKDKVIYGSDFPNYSGQTILGHARSTIDSVGYNSSVMRDNFLKLIGK
ncbi:MULTISPECIES: amidohydrolase family protein [Acidianus]|uniref:Amidohydrolase n=1 Tax=Candidatus Acidianus copahuensis TaxID=1160895 RepID=A0A031LU62_9CREN|nr:MULTISPECIES: amidohydrolase family protein [Acidianus]EZQ11366.1 amidohydrolase [Candidatus Acidianus copahuensis]NON61744.1 amidohydrolase [Acidianus sp. RZ1]